MDWLPSTTVRAYINYLRNAVCFAPETRLLTPDGDKPICDFQKGDLILSAPEHDPTAPLEVQVVEEVFEGYSRLLNLHVNGQVIRATALHPFYVLGKGWTATEELQSSDQLRSHDGRWVAVEAVTDNGEESVIYNLRVSQDHTCFVGSRDWGFSVWAHNLCAGMHHYVLRFMGSTVPHKTRF